MRKNVASQHVAFQMNSTTDGSAVTTGTPTVYYTIDGGAQGTGAGTATHEGNGQWSYAPAQAETNGNHVAFTMALSGAISQTVNVYPVAFDPSDAADLGVTALTGHTPQSGDVYPLVDTEITTLLNDLAAVLVDTSTTLDGKINTIDTVVDGIQTDLSNGTDGLGALKALIDTVDTVVDSILAMLDNARGEPGQGAPPVNPDMATKIDYLYKAWRNKKTQTSTTLSIFNDAGTVVDHKATVSDDATTFTNGEIGSGP